MPLPMPPSSDFILDSSKEGTSYFVLFSVIFVKCPSSWLISCVPSHVPPLEVINMWWKDAQYQEDQFRIMSWSSFTHAANTRKLSARSVFVHVRNSPGEWRRVQAAKCHRAGRLDTYWLFYLTKLIIWISISLFLESEWRQKLSNTLVIYFD